MSGNEEYLKWAQQPVGHFKNGSLAGLRYTTKFLLQRFEKARCDSDGVSDCVRCQCVFLARKVNEALDGAPTDLALPSAGGWSEAIEEAAKACEKEADACIGDIVPGDEIGRREANARAGALLTVAADIRALSKAEQHG